MILKLSNKENTYTFTVDDLNNGEKLYYKFQIPASDVVDGKYNMVLMDDDGNIITEEQVCMGYFNAETIQYNRGENVYINSPLNAILEDVRTITIDVPNYTIYPSEGYDAMKEVVVDAQPVYDNGYNEGENIGYDSGYTAGIEYVSENAEEIAAANAIDLVATELGTYYTKYSDNIVYPEVTGVFPNGDNFYDYAYTDKIYDTGIVPNANSEIELWFKPDAAGGTWGCIISAGYQDTDISTIRIRRVAYDNIYIANYGTGQGYTENNSDDLKFELKSNIFNHIKFSANGLYVNGVLYNNFDGDFIPQGTFVIDGFNGNSWTTGETGYYGMIKITTDGVENVIIPTQDGFMNITTNTILPQILTNIGSRYEYIDSTPIVLDNLIKSVDVQPKIDVVKYGIKFGRSTFAEVPDFYNFSNVTDMGYMFNDCGALQTLPLINTSNVTNMQGMFRYCSSLQTIPLIDTSNVTNMANMFEGCGSLQTLPLIDTSNVTYMNSMFETCGSLQSLPELDTRNVTTMNRFFRNYGGLQNLTSLPKFNVPKLTNISGFFYSNQVTMNNLTEVGGWENLNCNWNDNGGLSCLPNLTYQSCINVLNGLADVTELGGRTLKVHPNFLTTVGDEINIGVAKSWTITA